uniref:Enoyl reductase (ER) domain-containing protein n=1 Tax=Araucaria cunninghamii TaxID=56994 RepID=A0A0D6QRS6_ARACU
MAEHHVIGWAAHDESGILTPFKFTRRATGPNDVVFKVTHCGICHTDLHQIHNGWKTAKYPMVPGHEIVGIVTELGSNVKNFQVGDHVGVGFLVESCEACECCKIGQEQYCEKSVWSYNGIDFQGNVTLGGFSSLMVADYRFVIHVPKNLPLREAAPLLCAGITIYSPMKYYQMTEKGKHLGIVGLGGLGHMAVKFGKAFGLETTIISTSPNKQKEAIEVLGADHFLISKDPQQMQEARKSLDFIIDTVSAVHPLEPLLSLLKHDGKLVLVGLPEKPLQLNASALIFGGRHTIGASLIGGISETQEMVNFCAEHNVTCMVEIVKMSYVNTAMERLRKSDVRYRFVIDVENSFESEETE